MLMGLFFGGRLAPFISKAIISLVKLTWLLFYKLRIGHTSSRYPSYSTYIHCIPKESRVRSLITRVIDSHKQLLTAMLHKIRSNLSPELSGPLLHIVICIYRLPFLSICMSVSSPSILLQNQPCGSHFF